MERKETISAGENFSQSEIPFLPIFPDAAFLVMDAEGKVLQVSDELLKWYGQAQIQDDINLFTDSRNAWLRVAVSSDQTLKGLSVSGELYLSPSDIGIKVSVYIAKADQVNVQGDYCYCFIQRTGQSKHLSYEENIFYQKLRIILENTEDIVSLHALDGSFDYMSPSVEKVVGYTPEELTSLGPFYAVHPDDQHIIHDVLEKIRDGQNTVRARYRFIHKNGYEVWVDSVSQCSCDPQGNPSMITVVTRDINASKLLEDSLRRSEERYRTLVAYLPTGILLMDTEGKILEINQALLDILGSPGVESTKAINMFEFENLVNSGITTDLMTSIKERKIVNGQAEYVSKWGKKSYLLYSSVPVFDQSGHVIQIICNVRDITRIKRAEEKSQQQIDFLNVVINTMQEPFFVKDENHRWIMLNDAAVAMMGQPREKLIGKSDYELYPKVQADIFWEKDSLVLSQGANVNEEKITWSDGRERIIVTYKRLYTESNTGKKYIVGTIHDITEIKLSESRIKQSESKYHDLFDNANDHIFTTDLNGNFTNANKVMLDTIGVPIEEIGKFNIYSFCKPEVLEAARQSTDKLLIDGRVGPFEIETLEREGKSTFLEIQARLMFEDGKPIGIQGIARDISEKKQASLRLEQMNKELQELNASKDKFYSIIAHDLKNPFNSLIGFSELLLEEFDELSKDEMRDYVGIIRNTAKNSLILLENLLAWSRLQTGRMIYNPVALNLAKEVDAAVTILYSLSYRKKLQVDNLVDNTLMVKADQNMFLSIMHNLLMNAIKFTPSNGSIKVTAEIEGQPSGLDLIRVSVIDTGIGISKEDQAKLFSLTRPFTLPGTEKETGTGLGLLLTREMVEKHGCSLSIESELGAGSVFSFQLPLFVP